MRYFIWKKAYKIGIADVDIQHKKIFDIINKFYTELFSENFIQDSEVVYTLLEELRNYCTFHFKFERSLYSKEIANKYFSENDEIITKINNLINKNKFLNIIDLYVFAEYLRKWVVGHVLLLNDNSYKNTLRNEIMNA